MPGEDNTHGWRKVSCGEGKEPLRCNMLVLAGTACRDKPVALRSGREWLVYGRLASHCCIAYTRGTPWVMPEHKSKDYANLKRSIDKKNTPRVWMTLLMFRNDREFEHSTGSMEAAI